MEDSALKLSPSSASDFKSCPQLFKFRAVDRIPERPSAAAAQGALVHLALERLFAEPAERRTPERADALLTALWEEMRAESDDLPPGVAARDDGPPLATPRRLLSNLFKLEDPRELTATRLEWWVEYELQIGRAHV
jgi:putative RecB family exonuclease